MMKEEVLSHFGGVVELAKALGCKPQAISQWGETIPQGRAYQIEVLTGGKLKAEPPQTAPAQATNPPLPATH